MNDAIHKREEALRLRLAAENLALPRTLRAELTDDQAIKAGMAVFDSWSACHGRRSTCCGERPCCAELVFGLQVRG
jgi:hypothetical protein